MKSICLMTTPITAVGGALMRRAKIYLIASIVAFGYAAPLHAADLPTKTPLATPSVYNWTGWYLGLNAGGNWGSSHSTTNATTSDVLPYLDMCAPGCIRNLAAIGDQRPNTSGFTGGIHGGYNWQSGSIVLGLEADFEYFRSAGSTVVTGPITPFVNATVTSSVSTDWLFTARPRLGFAAGNWLFYGTGGIAVTRIKGSWSYSDTNSALRATSTSAGATKAGWVIGGGFESALPGNWLLGVEYLYVSFGAISTSVNITGTTDVLTHSANLQSNIVRARVSRKF